MATNITSQSGHQLQAYEHAHWIRFYDTGELPAPRWAYIASGAYVSGISLLAAVGNSALLWALMCSSILRSPSNLLIANLAFADLGMSVASFPLLFISSYAGHWLFGETGCNYYVVSAGFFGFVSITSMAAIAVDRFGSITRWSTWNLTYKKAFYFIHLTWIISLFLILPPLFGWSRFVLEGIQTSCTFDFFTRSPAALAYVIYLIVLGYGAPLAVIGVSYVAIIRHLVRHRRLMAQSGFGVNGDVLIRARTRTSSSLPEKRLRREQAAMESDIKASITCAVIVLLFMLAWTPYAVTALIGAFGDQTRLTPIVNALPTFLAKSSAVYNPIVYALMNDKFRLAIKSLVHRRGRALETGATGRRATTSQVVPPPQSFVSITEHLRLSLSRSSDPTIIAELHSLIQGRRGTAWSVKTLSPISLTSPLEELPEEGLPCGLEKLEFFSNITKCGLKSPGYFYEQVGPGLKYGKFYSPASLTGYGNNSTA